MWFWILAVATGLSNMVILILIKRPNKEAHKLWKHLLYAKLTLTMLLLRPITESVVGIFTTVSPHSVLQLQLLVALTILLMSVYARFYREDVTKFFSTGGNPEFHKFDEEISTHGQRDI